MKTFIAVDLETTGLSPENDYIIEIGALKYREGKCMGTFSRLVKPPVHISENITEITGIDNNMVENAPTIELVMKDFLDFVGEEKVLLGHNLRFDYSFLKVHAKRLGYSFPMKGLDTLGIARKFLKSLPKKNLGALCEYYQVINPCAHRAYEDAKTTAVIYAKLHNDFAKHSPEAFQPKDLKYKEKKTDPITGKQKKYLIDLVKYHKIQGEVFLDKDNMDRILDTMTKSEASKKIDEIILHYGKMVR